ncbi:MAG TPA: lycopene cyclase domain-containing protein [Ohtaekwangia sp.]|nr:lycopene cyclase domain-containing protein [Ohtaekwangia sp.]
MNPKYLYLAIDFFVILIPFSASFYQKAPFYKKWKHLAIAIILPATVFLVWDAIFTDLAIWGFNDRYITGVTLGPLPIEEILFFICIPYACVFTYFALNHLIEKDFLFPHQDLISGILIMLMLVLGIYHMDKAYTGVTFILLGIFLAYQMIKLKPRYMGRFYVAFFVTLIPFFIVNGILTGAFIEEQVVWYNNEENLGIRLGTIPIEDMFYGMLLLLMNVTIFEWLEERERFKHWK